MRTNNRFRPQIADRKKSETGYMLLAVVVMVALVLIALSIAAPVVARDLRRDKEVESGHRAEQYVRAVRLYYRKTGSYPPSMDALEQTSNIRYLRQKYIDPLTGKSDWRLIHQPKTTIKIPFGQELSGIAGAGLGSAAGMTSSTNSTTTVGATNALGAGFGGASVANPNNPGTSRLNGASGGTGTSSSSGSSSDTGMFGDSSGGLIYGVGPNRAGKSILNPNQQTTYETWEFWYDPRIELLYSKASLIGGGGIGAQPATSFGQNGIPGQSNGTPGVPANNGGAASGGSGISSLP